MVTVQHPFTLNYWPLCHNLGQPLDLCLRNRYITKQELKQGLVTTRGFNSQTSLNPYDYLYDFRGKKVLIRIVKIR